MIAGILTKGPFKTIHRIQTNIGFGANFKCFQARRQILDSLSDLVVSEPNVVSGYAVRHMASPKIRLITY